jgi:phosphoglucosamine mutase
VASASIGVGGAPRRTAGPDVPKRKLFGTDGVRGVAGEQLTAELALGLGRAATTVARDRGASHPRVLVIRDTRESGEMLEAALAAGVAAAGGEVLLGGVLPTPAAPLLVRRYGFDLAAVLSASHNPYRDNGIKFFGADGFKLSDATELEIERRLDERFRPAPAEDADGGPAIGRIRALHGTQEDYLRALQERFAGLHLDGANVALDCANGATHRVGPEIFRRLGATVTVVGDAPDGRNINAGCGSTHIDRLVRTVVDGGHDVGFAFDGDGDRVLAVDRHGAVVDGDELVALAALHLRRAGRLAGGGVAVTVMTNYGFHAAMESAGIEVASTQVGDRYVLEALRERGWVLGGEQSGHIIELGFAPSGDGIASALLTMEALAGADLADRHAMERLPQRLVNVRVADRDAAMEHPELASASAAEGEALTGRGRVLVRPSGTEPLVRVMVEAPSAEEADAVCARLVAIVERISPTG